MRICEDLLVKFRKEGNFQLIENFNFYIDKDIEEIKNLKSLKNEIKENESGHYIEIPKGFNTDFGSVPQLFQSFVSPIGKPTKCYVLHDRLCVLAKKGLVDEKDADKALLSALKIVDYPKWKALYMYYCIRFYTIILRPIIRYFRKKK